MLQLLDVLAMFCTVLVIHLLLSSNQYLLPFVIPLLYCVAHPRSHHVTQEQGFSAKLSALVLTPFTISLLAKSIGGVKSITGSCSSDTTNLSQQLI